MKYIDAEKLIAEIVRRREICADIAADERNEEVAEYYRGKEVAHDEISSLIDSLQQKIWKPSKEQMEALKCAIADVARFSKRGGRQVELENEPYYSALHSLYCNLEKQMED